MDQPDEKPTSESSEPPAVPAVKRGGISMPRLDESKRSRGYRHALAVINGRINHRRPKPSLPPTPWDKPK